MGKKMLRLDTIIANDKYQVRKSINGFFVGRLREVLRAGQTFHDAIIVNEKREVISGFHRLEAYRAELDPTAEVEVEVRRFKTDQEAYECAVAENTRHGTPLGEYDRKLIRWKLRRDFGVGDESIMALLGVDAAKLARWDEEIVHVNVGRGKKTEARPLKRGLKKLHGQTISEEEYERMHEHHSGTATLFHARKVMERIEADTVEDTEETLHGLAKLAEAIQGYLAGKEVAV